MQLKVPTNIFIYLVKRRNCEKLQERSECVRMYVYTYIHTYKCVCVHIHERARNFKRVTA